MKYPAFINDSDYVGMDSSVSETEQLRAMLQNLTRIHLLTAKHFDSFDDMIRAYILAGIEVFGLETGIVSRITEDGIYTVCDVVSPLDVLEKGQEFQLEDTYCREVYESREVLGFPEVGKLDYMSCHPVYQNLKLEAYLSAPIYVDGELFGTFNFTSTTPRAKGFSEHEHNLILLMANAIGAFILLRNKEERLLALNETMKRFVGYVAHDLRNPLGAILGLVNLAGKPGISEERLRTIVQRIKSPAERALELVATILESTAITSGKLTLERSTVSVTKLLKDCIEAVNLFAQESSVSFEVDALEGITVDGDSNRLHQMLSNLLINAIKYSPAEAQISLKAEMQGDKVTVSVTNPVVADAESQRVLNSRLYTSFGFGLNIVSEVLEAHGSELVIDEGSDQYQASFSFPIINS